MSAKCFIFFFALFALLLWALTMVDDRLRHLGARVKYLEQEINKAHPTHDSSTGKDDVR